MRQATPVFLIVDGHPTHHAKSVARFVARQQGRLGLFPLLLYAPWFNPDEQVWNVLKAHGTGRKPITQPPQSAASLHSP
jgi:hypothetical protein